MSRRRASYSPYRPLDRDTYAHAVYGNPRHRRPRPPYLRMVEPEPEGWRLWIGSALSLAVTVVLCLPVVGVWALERRLLGVI